MAAEGGYKKQNSSDGYVLLGGGGHKTISSLSVNYASSAGRANSVAWSNVSGRPSSLPASDVYSWAKASTKPSYSWSEIGSRPTKVSQFSNDSGYITSSASITGNAATATKLQTTRSIWGQQFNGSSNIGTELPITSQTLNFAKGSAVMGYIGSNNTNNIYINSYVGGNIFIAANDTSSCVGIGTTNPLAKFDIDGSLLVRSSIRSMTGGDTKLIFDNTDGEKYTVISFQEGGVEYSRMVVQDDRMILTTNFIATGGITAYSSSDIRLKQDLRKLDYLGIIKAMGGTFGFAWKKDNTRSIGWIAQHVLCNPYLKDIVETDEKGYYKINYWSPKLIATAFGAIEQVGDEVSRLKARVVFLESEVQRLSGEQVGSDNKRLGNKILIY